MAGLGLFKGPLYTDPDEPGSRFETMMSGMVAATIALDVRGQRYLALRAKRTLELKRRKERDQENHDGSGTTS
jgi:hypothetical protein